MDSYFTVQKKCTNVTLSEIPRGPFCCFWSHLRFLVDRRVSWPPGYAPHHFNLSSLLSPVAHFLPSATVSVILCEAPVILDTDAGLSVPAEGPSVWSWVPIFRTEGRISFSKCLAGKYVTRLENRYREKQVGCFKTRRWSVCDLCLPSHTHLKVKWVNPLPSRGIVYQEQAALECIIWDFQLNLL